MTRTTLSIAFMLVASVVLLSAPAIVSRGPGNFDVFVVGTDNQIYYQTSAAGIWTLVDGQGIWPALEPWLGPTPELPAPAVTHCTSPSPNRARAPSESEWSHQPRRIWVHTCDLDHPAALPNYLKAGFQIYDEVTIDQWIPSEP